MMKVSTIKNIISPINLYLLIGSVGCIALGFVIGIIPVIGAIGGIIVKIGYGIGILLILKICYPLIIKLFKMFPKLFKGTFKIFGKLKNPFKGLFSKFKNPFKKKNKVVEEDDEPEVYEPKGSNVEGIKSYDGFRRSSGFGNESVAPTIVINNSNNDK